MKLVRILLIILVVGVITTGCGSNVLHEVYDEEKLKAEASNILNMLCDENYGDISNQMSNKLAYIMPEDKLEEAWEPIKEDFGVFQEVTNVEVLGNEDLATVVIIARFSNREGKFTMTYNQDMMLEGIYIK